MVKKFYIHPRYIILDMMNKNTLALEEFYVNLPEWRCCRSDLSEGEREWVGKRHWREASKRRRHNQQLRERS